MSRDGRVDLPFEVIADRLRTSALPPAQAVDVVVAIARGGTVPGALVAYELERPMRLLRLAYRDEDNRPVRDAPMAVGNVPDVKGLRVLLVDDVSVSGFTLARAREVLEPAETLTLVVKGPPGIADVVLFPDVPSCVRWPWHEDVPGQAAAQPPRAIVVGGVSGSGKTTVGNALAERLGWTYIEGDDHHPPANVEKMRSGRPLDDEDRRPWLASLRRALDAELEAGRGAVVASSALKAAYRRALGTDRAEVAVVMLDGPRETIAAYLAARSDHFFDPALLDSQFADLERPAPDEDAMIVPVDLAPEAIVGRIVARYGLRENG